MNVEDAKLKLCPIVKTFCRANNCMFWIEKKKHNS
jgi:hypothetical protein